MINRRTALLIAEGYKLQFRRYTGNKQYRTKPEDFYLFLFALEYEVWVCNLARQCTFTNSIFKFVATLHTGESIAKATKEWTWEQRRRAGQKLLKRMAEDYLNAWHATWLPGMAAYEGKEQREHYPMLLSSLELDGYSYRGSKLYYSEQDVLNIQEEQGILSKLYSELNLRENTVALHHLKLSEEHYLTAKWDDSISNSRKYLECVMMQVAAEHSRSILKTELSVKIMERPVEIRDYLENQQLIDGKEKDAFAKVYGLLSHTGSHPNMAKKDQARLLRQLSLTLAQFIMLRLQGTMKSATN